MANVSFIIVDDRELDCFIAEKLIEKVNKDYITTCFYEAKLCLEHIATDHPQHPIIILLDIMMPVMTGFDFLDEFERLDSEKKKWYKIVPITTSLNKSEIQRIGKYPSVIKVLPKPYTIEDIKLLVDFL